MPKITRKLQKIFALGSANTGQFGSALAGTKVLTDDPDIVQALAAWEEGWLDAVIGPQTLPTYEEDQGVKFVTTYQLAYLFQEGVPEYLATETYYANSVVKQPGTFNLYGSLTDGNIGNALTDTANWAFLQNLQKEISVTMGFESSPTGRKLIFNGQTIAKTSGGTVNGAIYYRAYEYLWNNVLDTYAPVTGGRGLTALADFDANKKIAIPDLTNMSPMQVGSIVNSAGRNNIGSATVTSTGSISINSPTITQANLPTSLSGININGIYTSWDVGTAPPPGSTNVHIGAQVDGATAVSTSSSLTLQNTGSGTPLSLSGSYTGSATSVVQPVFGIYYYINY